MGTQHVGRSLCDLRGPSSISGPQLIEDLAYGWPIIVGLRGEPIGHAYVLTAVYYSVNPGTRLPIFDKVVLRDPWPGSRSHHEWSWWEFSSRVMFTARVRIQHL